MRAAFRFRLRLVLAFLILIGVFIFVRLYFIQVVQGNDYAEKADRQYMSSGSGLFDRGSIYFTRKDGTLISAASLASGFLVAINPQTLQDAEGAYEAISAIALGSVDRETFLKAAGNENAVYVEVAHHLTDEQGKALSANKSLKGVQVFRERWRMYPGATLASQTLGVVARQSGDTLLAGRTGLEKKYEDVLSRSGEGLYKNFFAELFADLGNALGDARSAQTGDVLTTIEPEVQTRLLKDLLAIEAKYASRETGGIIMDPSTGAIIALGTIPTYDANAFQEADQSLLGNPLVGHVYEFGSIMKPLTMAAALDVGVVTPHTTYNDTGCTTLDTSTICNFDLKARGTVPMQQILSQSLNLGAAFLALRLGPSTLRSYFTSLGFGEKTGIDLPAEASGLIKNLNSPRQIEYATAAFGQGIAITPVEMIRALGALANGGALVDPHVVRAIELDSGLVKPLDWTPDPTRQVFKGETVRQVSEMLTLVVDKALASGAVRIPTMSVAAKTGTSELTKPGGGYYDDRFFHSFFGYFPSYAPRFIILLYTNDPRGVQYASETLTSTFMDLTHFLIDYYDIPPDRGVATSTPSL